MHLTTKNVRWWITMLMTAFSLNAIAQQRAQVKGSVISDEGESLPGVTVRVIDPGTKKTQTSMTNENGVFVIDNLTANKRYDFTFSYIGYQSNTVKSFLVNAGDNNSLLSRMQVAEVKMNDEVVVTALGIKREEKSLGYAAQKLDENSIKDARTNNWAGALAGKVAGLNIQGTGAGPMGSTRITLRGESSLNLDNNQALIIVDGVPISNKISGTGFSSHLSADSPVDFGSGVSDINPDDIEKVTVLKGPGATALYGSRASGGAIIITTKSGQRKGKGIGVTYNTNVSIDQVNRWPDYQFEYGEGRTSSYYSYGNSADGNNTSTNVAAGRAWGPKFNGQEYFQYNPLAADGKPTERTPWVAHDDYISGFFRTGLTLSNNISLEGGSEKGSARLSVTHLKNQWIIPNTGFERINTALSVSQKISDKLTINGKVNYTNKKSDNLPAAGYNNQTLMYFLIIGTAPNIRPEWFKPYWQPGLEQVRQKNPFNPGPDNPYLGMYEMLNKMNRNGLIGNISASYAVNDRLNILLRSGTDLYFEYRSQQRPFSMTKYPRGMYREQNIFSNEVNTDFLITYKSKPGSLISYNFSAGGNAMRQYYNFAGMNADQLAQPGIYQISNSLNQAEAVPEKTRKAINSVYGMAQLSWNESIFLDLTGRNDWSSALPFKNNSFFYPSVSTSFLLTELANMPAVFSFAKLRLSWAQVGNDTRPYQTAKYYDNIYGNNFTNPVTLFNPDLKPEITSSYEAGLDIRLLDSRIGVDLAVYNNNSRNQILAIPLDPVTGYANALVNAGLINSRGIELQVYAKPVVRKNFTWKSTVNWSSNRSYVRELREGINNQVIYSHSGNVTIEARVGGRMGDMYGRGFQRTPEGEIIYSSVGLPAELDRNSKKWGNAFPDWKAGWQNEFTIKRFRISVLVDGQKGGHLYSQTNHKNNTLGKTKITLPGRDEGIVGNGVVLQSDGKYTPNTVRVDASAYYDNIYNINNAEMNIFDASFIKIREVRVEFKLPTSLLKKIGVQETSAAIYGRELFNFTDFPGFDPEGGNLNNGTLTPGVELTQFPSTRNMGINLTFKF